MAKPNYQFAKRQKELAKKKAQEEKQKRKAARHKAEPVEGASPSAEDDVPK